MRRLGLGVRLTFFFGGETVLFIGALDCLRWLVALVNCFWSRFIEVGGLLTTTRRRRVCLGLGIGEVTRLRTGRFGTRLVW